MQHYGIARCKLYHVNRGEVVGRVGTNLFGQLESVDVVSAMATLTLRGDECRFAICSHEEVDLVAVCVDREAEIDRFLPLPIVTAAAHKEVEAAHADVLVRREIKGVTIGMQERCHFGALRVDGCAHILRLAPTAVCVSLGAIDVGIAVSA